MASIRKPFQGVTNIVRFNGQFYVLSLAFLVGSIAAIKYLPEYLHIYIFILCGLVFATTLITLLVSYYVYDYSDLYTLNWLSDEGENSKIVNINAGFDETSILLEAKFKDPDLIVLDFYDPGKHTEISIKRARKAYPPYPHTRQITTSNLTLTDQSADKVFVLFAAHEIRNDAERVVFFKEIHRILKPNGQVFVTEHLRDTVNFMAYNIGFFHFLPLSIWYQTFESAEFVIIKQEKITPFITNFTLQKNGIST